MPAGPERPWRGNRWRRLALLRRPPVFGGGVWGGFGVWVWGLIRVQGLQGFRVWGFAGSRFIGVLGFGLRVSRLLG